MWGHLKICFLEMPPSPTPIFTAPDAPVVPEAVPSDSDTESGGDVMEIQQQMDAERKRLEDAIKAQIEDLRGKSGRKRLTGINRKS